MIAFQIFEYKDYEEEGASMGAVIGFHSFLDMKSRWDCFTNSVNWGQRERVDWMALLLLVSS